MFANFLKMLARKLNPSHTKTKDCLAYAEIHGLAVMDILKELYSAKISGRRPIFSKMLKALEAGKYDGILA